MKQIIFTGALDDSNTTIATLASTKTGILDVSLGTVSDALPTDTSQKFQILTNTSARGIVASIVFAEDDVKRAVQLDYTAGTAQVVNVTPTLAASQAKGDEYQVKIINTTPGTANLKTKSYSVFHQGTDYTVATLIDAFVTLIGADTDIGVTATDSTTTLTLTAQSPDTHFRVALACELENDTITYTTKNVPSFGTEAKVKLLEKECWSFDKGVFNRVLHAVTPDLEASGTYDITLLEIEVPTSDKSGRGSKMIEKHILYICEASGGANPVGSLFTS